MNELCHLNYDYAKRKFIERGHVGPSGNCTGEDDGVAACEGGSPIRGRGKALQPLPQPCGRNPAAALRPYLTECVY